MISTFTDKAKVLANSASRVSTVGDSFNPAYTGNASSSPFMQSVYNGESLSGTIADRKYYADDYLDREEVIALSEQMFIENMYGATLINRLVDNVIHTGLKLETVPVQKVMNIKDNKDYIEWCDEQELLYSLWGSDSTADYEDKSSLGTLERIAYTKAMISGDVLRIEMIDEETRLPKVRLVDAKAIRTPPGEDKTNMGTDGFKIVHGVEIDKKGRHLAYHVDVSRDDEAVEFVRVRAHGIKTGREVASLIYAEPPMPGHTRGRPLLSRLVQPLSQINTYIACELSAAELNARIGIKIVKKDKFDGVSDFQGIEPNDGMHQIQVGNLGKDEDIKSFDTKRPNLDGIKFKDSIFSDMGAALGIPPEILRMMYGSSYSASRQINVDFMCFLIRERKYFADQFSKKNYNLFFSYMAHTGQIKADGYTKALLNKDIFKRKQWENCQFTGLIKPNVDLLKEFKAYKGYIDEGLMTRTDAAALLTGTNALKNIKRLAVENPLLSDARDELNGSIFSNKKLASEGAMRELVETILEENFEEYLNTYGGDRVNASN